MCGHSTCSIHQQLPVYLKAGVFRGGKFSWMLKLLLARGKNFVGVESRLYGN